VKNIVLDRALPAHIDDAQPLLFIVDPERIQVVDKILFLLGSPALIDLLKQLGVNESSKFFAAGQVAEAAGEIDPGLAADPGGERLLQVEAEQEVLAGNVAVVVEQPAKSSSSSGLSEARKVALRDTSR
jgi:hypothetical protein